MKKSTTLTSFFLFLLVQCSFAGNIIKDSILINNIYRNYTLFIPADYPTKNTYPLIINLHARCSNADEHMQYTQMNLVADTAGFIVVYPSGTEDPNDPFRCVDWNDNGRHTWNDIAFISALIDTLVSRHKVNSSQVFACGFSRGGFMSYTLACELKDKIKGIAVVGGGFSIKPLINSRYFSCLTDVKKPVLIIHGTLDADVNYFGRADNWASVDLVFEFWKQQNNCLAIADTTLLLNKDINDQSTVTKISYGDCADATSLVLLKINDGGHSWPGSSSNILVEIPPKNMDINASAEIWNFFHTAHAILSSDNGVDKRPHLKIYPNPVNNYLIIDIDSEKFDFLLYDSNGKLVREERQVLSGHQLDCTDLSRGLYFIIINTREGIYYNKFIR